MEKMVGELYTSNAFALSLVIDHKAPPHARDVLQPPDYFTKAKRDGMPFEFCQVTFDFTQDILQLLS